MWLFFHALVTIKFTKILHVCMCFYSCFSQITNILCCSYLCYTEFFFINGRPNKLHPSACFCMHWKLFSTTEKFTLYFLLFLGLFTVSSTSPRHFCFTLFHMCSSDVVLFNWCLCTYFEFMQFTVAPGSSRNRTSQSFTSIFA